MRRAFLIVLFLACSGLARADTSSDRICGKLSIDPSKQENWPFYHLRCEHVADSETQIQLLIEGEKPLVLSGVEGVTLASDEAHFDPASISVRLLEGQPNLYWIRYGHTIPGPGGGDIDYQRHWVVQKGNTGHTLFDKWTEVYENNRSGNFLSTSEDVAIEYGGSTLRVTNTRFQGQAVEDDIHEPGEPGYRASGSTESLTKVTREIDAGTGRALLEKTISAQFNGNALFLDDGIAGWLLMITNPDFRLVSWKPGEMFPRHLLPDPEKLEGIRPVATCWLYNRMPWNEANATRTYPPAAPGQVRPDHFAPDYCCTVETSADGNRTFLYETAKDQNESEKPGRLLALFDRPSQSCYSAHLAQDGRWGKALFDYLGNPVFSPDGKRIAYRAKQRERWFVMVDNQRGPEFDRVSSPVFSPDSQHLAYWARQDKKEFIVLDDRPGPAFDGAGFPIFGPHASKVAYRAREGNQWFVVRGDEKGPVFDDIGYYTMPESGRGSDIADVVFSPDGRQLAYAARRGQQWFIVRDGRPDPAFEHVGLPVFGPDGRLAYRARRNDREFIQLGEHRGPEFDFVGAPVFRPDGRQLAYWARQGKTEFIVRGERKGPVFELPNRVGAPVFNRDGSQVIYWARQGEKEFIMSGEKKGPAFDSIEAPAFNPHAGQIAYRVQRDSMEFVMVGDQKGPEFDFDYPSRSRPLVFSLDGRQLAYRARQAGKEFILLGENKGPAFDEVGDPVFGPDGGRLAYRARQATRWFLAVDPLEGQKPAAGTQGATSPAVPLRKTAPRLIPHPIIAGVVLGGSARGQWVKIDNGNLPEANPSACSSETGQCCRTLGPEWIPQGLLYKLYSFDEPLGECPGGKAKACDNMVTGDTDLTVDFAACPVKKFSMAIAGPWSALPRRPRVLKNHQDLTPVVRNFLDRKGLRRAPVRIEYVHGVDLDGDGMEERIIHARSRKEVGDHGDPNDYSLLLLVRTVKDKPETTAISAWWPGEQEKQGPYEIYDSSYADANGDGVMEIFVDWRYYEGGGIRVYALRDGKPVETELGYFNGL